jgi:hypothetical protein
MQEITLDTNSIYDVLAGAVNEAGEPINLKNLVLTLVEGDGVELGTDENTEDAADDISTLNIPGAVAVITATAVDEEGHPYDAEARITLAEPVEEPRDMVLTFTKRVA